MSQEVKEDDKPEEPVEKEFYKQFKLLQYDDMMEGFRKEMSAQVGEMQRWRDYHRNGDPESMWNIFEDYMEAVRKAINYRNLYSKRKKELKANQGHLEKAARIGDIKEVRRLKAERYDIENEMTSLIFRVYRIYFYVKPQLPVEGEDDSVVEYHD